MTSTTSASDLKFKVQGLDLERGQRVKHLIRAVELPDASWVELPMMVVRGARPGPVMYLGAAIHGDEINGVEIVARVAREINVSELNGTILAVPVQNPMAFRIQHRYPLGHMLKSPMDQNPADVWASFPGDVNGNTAAVIAHILFEQLMVQSDYMIDIHTPTTGGKYAPFAFLPPPRCGAIVERAEALAKAFGADFILANDKGMYVGDKNPHVVAADHGVIAFGVELGEGGRLDPIEVERGVRGVLNVLRAVSMLPGAVESSGRRMVIRTMSVIRARRAGLLHLRVGLGEEVAAGQVVATVTNVFGEIVEEISSSHAGPVVRLTTFPIVSTGERVAQLGIPR
jgi:predicted deacylase